MHTRIFILPLIVVSTFVGCKKHVSENYQNLYGKAVTAREDLNSTIPPKPGLERLQDAIGKYEEISENGGWQKVASGPTLKRGSAGKRVLVLRKRLAITEDLEEAGTSNKFDTLVESAVKRFQRRHGIQATGKVGGQTLAALNVPVEARLATMKLNLERWGALPEDFGERYLIVNIPDFQLDVLEADRGVMSMRVVVGRAFERSTPLIKDTITHIVISPTWSVPASIAKMDILPQVIEDDEYLANHRMLVFDRSHPDTPLDPSDIDWDDVDTADFPYVFRQEPGKENSLGRIKFVFPNHYDIYLHDTPARELFARSERDFSSGCIRIERPVELAEFLLGDEIGRDSILAMMEVEKERTFRLSKRVPIYIVYWTCWVNADGAVQFRNDVYGLDHAEARSSTSQRVEVVQR